MRATFTCLAVLAAAVCLPQWCLAQKAEDEARADREMQEDVEVLRRLVTETVHTLYRQSEERLMRSCVQCHAVTKEAAFDRTVANFLGTTHHFLDEIHASGFLKGKLAHSSVTSLANYVPGHGIIVQLEAPPPVVDRDVKEWLAAESASDSRWEALLRETQGKPEEKTVLQAWMVAPQHRRVHRLILTEKLVELLAENGKKLRRLPADEHVTIAFTFRPPSKEKREADRTSLLRHYFPEAMWRAAAKAASDGSPASGYDFRRPDSQGKVIGGGGGGMALGAIQGGGGGSARIQTVTGDLLMRQEKFAEAIAAYEKALKDAGIDVTERKGTPSAEAAEVIRKLVQAHVGAKNTSQAVSLLQWLERSRPAQDELEGVRRLYLDIVGTLPTPDDIKLYMADDPAKRRERLIDRLLAETEEEGDGRVPSRMVISCTRKQLEEVASGKVSKTAFAGQITLKYYRSGASPDKKTASPKN